MTAQNFDFDLSEAAEPSEDPANPVQPGEKRAWIDRFSIATKLNIATIASAAIVLIVAFTVVATVAYYSDAGRHVANVAGLEVRTTHATMDIDDAAMALRDYRESGDEKVLEPVAPFLSEAQANIAYTRSWISGGMPAETQDMVAGFEEDLIALQGQWAEIQQNPDERSVKAFGQDLAAVRTEIAAYARTLRGSLGPAASELFAGIDFVLILDVMFVLSAVAIALVGARIINRNVVGSLSGITDTMEDLSKGKMDTPIPGLNRDDEIGAMARALAVFRKSSIELRDLNDTRARDAERQLEQEKLLSEQMRGVRREKGMLIEGMADGFEVSVGEVIEAVSAASDQLKATSRQMVTLADNSNDQAEDASEAMQKANGNIKAAANSTDEFSHSINEINRQASASAELARGASVLVTNANAKMDELSLAALEVGEIVELIQSIAQRTNLLALNASIEAARGGEAGRGFAVVASEVKDLAMQTSRATNSVTDKIMAMQNSTQSSVDDLTEIVNRIEELEQAAVMIASAVDEQSASGEALARNIDTVAEGAAQVGTQLESLRSASHETGSAADDVVDSANALDAHAKDLREKANRFIADVRKSARDLEEGDGSVERAAG